MTTVSLRLCGMYAPWRASHGNGEFLMVYTVDTKPVGGHYPKVYWGGDPFPTPPVLQDFDDGLPNTNGPEAGVPLYGGALPKVVRWDEPATNPPPDFDSMPTMNVSERARQVIEAVEPGVHQFFPVDYIDRKDRLIETRYWFYVCNRRDTIHPTASNMLLNKWGEYIPPLDAVRRGQELPPHVDPKLPGKFVLDASKIGGEHMWREPRAGGMRLMSDAMCKAIQDAGLTGILPREVDVV